MANTKLTIKEGYKQTDVGIIPKDWKVKQFCEIGKLNKGKGLLKEDIKRNCIIPAIPYTALYTDYSEIIDYNLIKWFIDDESQSVIVDEPCLLLASSSNMEANTGKASALIGYTSVAIGREIIIFKTSSDCKYISYLLSTAPYRRKTLTLARGTTIKHLYPATFQSYQVALPPLPEQQAIAEVLSDVDALVTSLDQLITKKRNIKQGTMQLLLTGKKRLAGFSGEWETKTLGDIAPLQRGFDLPNKELRKGIYPVIYSNGILNTHSEYKAKAPGIVTGRSGTIGKVNFIEQDYFPHNTSLWVTDFKGNYPKFVYYIYVSVKLERFGTGSGVPTLNRNDVHLHKIPLPPTREEQKAIAQILSEMDAEIEALEQKRDKYKAVKQGMMQELLTGKIRLKINF